MYKTFTDTVSSLTQSVEFIINDSKKISTETLNALVRENDRDSKKKFPKIFRVNQY